MFYWQYRLFNFVVVFGFIVLFFQLFFLQVINGREYRLLTEENRLRKLTVNAPRGLITDRNGNRLAVDQPVYRLVSQPEKTLDRVVALSKQEENKNSVYVDSNRYYPFGSSVAHLVGYLGSVDQEELNDDKLSFKGYGLNTLLGRYGVESQYENVLKGHNGSKLVEVDTQGNVVREISQLPAVPGKKITLAVDLRLQQAAEQLMVKQKGSVIASDPQTGEIIVLYSSPSFDPNVLTSGLNDKNIQGYLEDENQPLFNRVLAGRYPPGSTFKLVTAMAGLAEGKITSLTKINDTGVIRVGAFSYSNWYWTGYGRTEGEIALAKALARSTDTFFYLLGGKLGETKLIEWARKFGLDKPYNIDLSGEVGGFIADPEWKKQNRGESWFLGNTYHLAIGQGDISLTPLGVNMMTGVFANNGKVCVPRVLKINAENTPYQASCREVVANMEYVNEIKNGMIMACSTGGTAWPFFGFQPQVACKTGTAETGVKDQNHAWFTAFAPVDKPSIVITVLVENGGEGSSIAGPIAKELLKLWFEGKNE